MIALTMSCELSRYTVMGAGRQIFARCLDHQMGGIYATAMQASDTAGTLSSVGRAVMACVSHLAVREAHHPAMGIDHSAL